jgi:hypothetical protein
VRLSRREGQIRSRARVDAHRELALNSKMTRVRRAAGRNPIGPQALWVLMSAALY